MSDQLISRARARALTRLGNLNSIDAVGLPTLNSEEYFPPLLRAKNGNKRLSYEGFKVNSFLEYLWQLNSLGPE